MICTSGFHHSQSRYGWGMVSYRKITPEMITIGRFAMDQIRCQTGRTHHEKQFIVPIPNASTPHMKNDSAMAGRSTAVRVS